MSKKIKSFKKKYKIENIGEKIRNNTAAHINPDFDLYNKVLNYVDRNEIIAMLSDFLEIIQEMQTFFFKLPHRQVRSATPPPPFSVLGA